MKTRKQKFAEWMLSHSRLVSAEGVQAFSNQENLGIQVKTINSNGDFVIKFSERDTFIKPSEWLYNYQVSVKERYEEAKALYLSVCSQAKTKSASSERDEQVSEMSGYLSQAKQQLGTTSRTVVQSSDPRRPNSYHTDYEAIAREASRKAAGRSSM